MPGTALGQPVNLTAMHFTLYRQLEGLKVGGHWAGKEIMLGLCQDAPPPASRPLAISNTGCKSRAKGLMQAPNAVSPHFFLTPIFKSSNLCCQCHCRTKFANEIKPHIFLR